MKPTQLGQQMELVSIFGLELYLLGPTDYVPPDDSNRIQLKRCFKHKVGINKYRNLRTQQMFVHSLVCIFYNCDNNNLNK
jgi:hypothetical protein